MINGRLVVCPAEQEIGNKGFERERNLTTDCMRLWTALVAAYVSLTTLHILVG